MSSLNINKSKMEFKQINKKYRTLTQSSIFLNLSPQKSKSGIIYSLYSDKSNSIEIGFAQNNKILQNRVLEKGSILLDKKRGKKKDLDLLIKTLNELDIKISSKLNFKYSNILIRHLSILGWPVGRSLYKQRTIKKELSFA